MSVDTRGVARVILSDKIADRTDTTDMGSDRTEFYKSVVRTESQIAVKSNTISTNITDILDTRTEPASSRTGTQPAST